MDELTPLLVSFGQLFFYGGLLALFVGVPVWLWLCVRFLRDVHAIRESIERMADQRPRQVAAAHLPPAPEVSLSAFGR